MSKIKIFLKFAVKTFLIIFLLIFVYILLSFVAHHFSESVNTKVTRIDKEIQLPYLYDRGNLQEVFAELNRATNGELDGTTLHRIYVRHSKDGIVFIFQKEYTWIQDIFATSYTPIKEVQIYYDRVSQNVIEITISIGNSLLISNKYTSNDWKEIAFEN